MHILKSVSKKACAQWDFLLHCSRFAYINKVMLRIPSTPRSIDLLQGFLDQMLRKYQISPDIYGNILISLTEAVNNAIIHGNAHDESKTVEVQVRKTANCLAVRVSDQGRGFDPAQVPDPTAPENRCKCGGRGVFLMHQLSDGIRYANNGSTVEMQFRLDCQEGSR
jgi:serine/threonine-protein kinase RsbW